jgi:hypothetical protein
MKGSRVRYRIVTLLVAALVSGCSIKSRECGSLFDKLRGKGPVLIDAQNSSALSTQFLYQTSQSNPALGDLVTNHGTPDAISVEREFLQPNRLRLFYPADGQVFILDDVGGQWSMSGLEPLATTDLELLDKQRQIRVQPVKDPLAPSKPAVNSTEARQMPGLQVQPVEFRGRLDLESAVFE